VNITQGSVELKKHLDESDMIRMSLDDAEATHTVPNPASGYKKVILPSLRERDRYLAAGKINQ
jgi:hypothetical protein